MLLLLLIFVLAALSFIFLVTKHKKNESFHPPPGPKGLPLIGNLHQFDALKPHIYLSNLAKTYGPISSLRIGRVSMVAVQSAKTAKEVLKTQDHNFCFRPLMLASQRITYNCMDLAFSPYNEYYREAKKILTVHLVSSKRVQSFSTVRQDEVSKLVKRIYSLSTSSKIINLSELTLIYSNSNLSRIAFGKSYENYDEGTTRSKFHNLLNEAQAIVVAFFFADYFPYMGWLDKLTGQSSRLERAFEELDRFFDEVIGDHLDQNKPTSDHEDVIDVLLQLRKQRSFRYELTLNHIKAILLDIFVAGSDTSAAMIVWAMTELQKNPDTMRKVQQELRNSVKNKDRNYITMEDLPKLDYFKAIIKETLRLHPAAPLLFVREALQKCKIEGYDLNPKTRVLVNVWAIMRDPNSWEDPEKFMPERFLNENSSVDYKGQDYKFIPFGSGRRICPGMHMGIANLELALANILYSFDWEIPAGMNPEDLDDDVLPGITMHKNNPLCLRAIKYL